VRKLSEMLTEANVAALRELVGLGRFSPIDMEVAMKFILTDGIVPVSGYRTQCCLELEDWLRASPSASPER
jgi:hypothetical protein